MTDTLKKIYEDRFYTDWRVTPEYRTLADAEEALWEQVKPLIGPKMIDQLMESQSHVNYQTNYEWFQKGFRLGASLMLELLE